jgi:hypothetical protein
VSVADVEILRQMWDIRNGQLAYQRAYWEPDEALAAAGVSSP